MNIEDFAGTAAKNFEDCICCEEKRGNHWSRAFSAYKSGRSTSSDMDSIGEDEEVEEGASSAYTSGKSFDMGMGSVMGIIKEDEEEDS